MSETKDWIHEYQFTGWLLDHFDRFANEVGINMVPMGTEMKAESYAADIVAVTPRDELVVVEAQLWGGDHKHFGAMLTYAAGLDASIAIWIAEDFSREHQHALHRLNRTGDLSLYAVKFSGRSADTVLFELIVAPQHAAKDAPTPLGRTARERVLHLHRFWTRLGERDPRIARLVPRVGGRSRWLPLPGCDAVIAIEIFGPNLESTAYVLDEQGRGEPIAAHLASHRAHLDVTFEDMGNARWPFDRWQGAIRDEANWDVVIDDLCARIRQIENAVTPCLRRPA